MSDHSSFNLNESDKFALLAIENVYADLPEGCEQQLSDGTWVLSRVPFDIEKWWKERLGSIRLEQIEKANVVLIRTMASDNPGVLDGQQEGLAGAITRLFYLLQLSGVIEYEGADLLKGSFVNGMPDVRQASELPEFRITRGHRRSPITLERLEVVAEFRAVIEEMDARAGEFVRIIRGVNVLMDGMRREHGQDRLHQFVRALEALVQPEIARTKRQFVHRCQTLARTGDYARDVLGEAFDLRSQTEHLNDAVGSLSAYTEDEREDIALHRTRQMERLASFAFSRILESEQVREHFRDEGRQDAFWRNIDDAGRRAAWGTQLDLSTIPLVRENDGWGRGVR